MTKTVTATIIPAALAYGLDAHSARNCADRVADARKAERTKAKADAPTSANPLAAVEEFFSKPLKTTPKGAIKGSRITLKTNKEVRAQLTAACKKLGGSRLQPIDFATYSAFLNGFPALPAIYELIPVGAAKGAVLLDIAEDGKITVKTNKG